MELAKIIPEDGPNINEVEKYINKYESEVIVIKCGGSVLLEKKLFNQFIEDISIINKIGLSAIVVHGGGKNIKKKLDENNIETRFVKGLRVSDERTIHHIEKALLDLNIEIIQELKSKKSNVCSISPRDNNIINIIPENEELGYVGIPKKINKEKILKLINNQQIPIVAPLGLGDDEKVYNINADVAAGSIAKELNARRLLLMTDVEGVLDENQNLISEINLDLANEMLKNNIITGGMIPKINTCLDAISNGVRGVVIVDGRKPHSILYELFSDKGAGTLIRK